MFFILNSCFTFVTTNREININTFQKIKIMKTANVKTIKQAKLTTAQEIRKNKNKYL